MSTMIDAICGPRVGRAGRNPQKRGSWRQDEPIAMRERRHSYFPKAFMWRGNSYRVDAVKRCWTVSRRGPGGKIEQRCFEIWCGDRIFEVYQDIRLDAWYLKRQAA